MGDVGLVELARRYVALSDELEAVRGEIRRAVINGGGGAPEVHPTLGGELPAKAKAAKTSKTTQSTHPSRDEVWARSKAADEAALELLRSQSGLKTGQIAAALQANKSTTGQRMQRLADRGMAARDDSGGWSATSSP